MNYGGISKEDILNGDGLRTVLFVSGCVHNCKGCHSVETHNPDYGDKFDDNAKKIVLDSLKEDYIQGLTLSGGDPLYFSNRECLTELCKEVKELYPDKDIWLYSGYKYEDVKDLEIFKYIDVMVDGKFDISKKDKNLKYRGSSNQRIIYVNSKI